MGVKKQVRFSDPVVTETHLFTRYLELSQGLSCEYVQKKSSESSPGGASSHCSGTYQETAVCETTSKSEVIFPYIATSVTSGATFTPTPYFIWSLPGSSMKPSPYYAGSKSGTTPQPSALPQPPQHWLVRDDVGSASLTSCAHKAMNSGCIAEDGFQSRMDMSHMTLEIKALLRVQ